MKFYIILRKAMLHENLDSKDEKKIVSRTIFPFKDLTLRINLLRKPATAEDNNKKIRSK
jgi:hypothetical protein